MSSAAANRLLRLPQVLERTGLSRSMVYLLESQGRFPGRVKVGVRAVAWPEDEVKTWIDAKKANRHVTTDEQTAQTLGRALASWVVIGISTQSSFVQQAVAENLDLRFPLLSDANYALARAPHLPMLHVGRRQRLPRIILAVRDRYIDRIVYPSTSPSSATEVLREWAGISATGSDGSSVYSCDPQIDRN